MAIDWDAFDDDVDAIIQESSDRTDKKLSSRISSITRMTDQEVEELFPDPADIKKLSKLMKVVKSAEEKNSKINKIVENSEEFAGVIITLLDKFT